MGGAQVLQHVNNIMGHVKVFITVIKPTMGIGNRLMINYGQLTIVHVVISCSGRSAGQVQDVVEVSPEDGESSQGAVLPPAG